MVAEYGRNYMQRLLDHFLPPHPDPRTNVYPLMGTWAPTNSANDHRPTPNTRGPQDPQPTHGAGFYRFADPSTSKLLSRAEAPGAKSAGR
ncbi:hypothetical protein AHF37_04683 [Paragonimus kellicotti]|nr:hypothetical protein AHF37_04683 [Paragonimus kellicotti]